MLPVTPARRLAACGADRSRHRRERPAAAAAAPDRAPLRRSPTTIHPPLPSPPPPPPPPARRRPPDRRPPLRARPRSMCHCAPAPLPPLHPSATGQISTPQPSGSAAAGGALQLRERGATAAGCRPRRTQGGGGGAYDQGTVGQGRAAARLRAMPRGERGGRGGG